MSTVVTIQINADGTAAVKALKQVGDQGKQAGENIKQGGKAGADGLKSISDQARESARSIGSLSDAVKRMAVAAAGAFAGIKLSGLVRDAAMANSRFEQLGNVMEVVGRNAGYSADQVHRYAAQVRDMGITMTESRQTVIRMIQAQMDLTQASQLARLAQDAAVIGNINSTEALGRLIHGIQAGQTEVLRGIGINVQFEQGYRQLAATLGKSTDELTNAERAQARVNQVMEAGTQIAGAYDASMESAGKQLGSTARYLEDLQVMWGGVFSDAFRDLIFSYSDGLKAMVAATREMAESGTLARISRGIADIVSASILLAKVAATIYTARVLASAAAYTAQLVAQGVAYARNINLAAAWAAANSASTAAAIRSAGVLATAINGIGYAFAGWQIGTAARKRFLEVELAGIALVEGLLVGWEKIKHGAGVAFAAIEYAWDVSIAAMQQVFATFVRGVASGVDLLPDWAGGSNAQALREYADGLRTVDGVTEEYQAKLAALRETSQGAEQAIRDITGAMAEEAIARRESAGAAEEQAGAAIAAAGAIENAAVATGAAAKASRELSESQKDAIAMLDDMESAAQDAAQWLASLATANRDMAEELAGVGASQRQYNRDMEQLDELIRRLAGSYDDLDPEARAYVERLREQIKESKQLTDELDDLQDHLTEVGRIMQSFGDSAFASPILDMIDGIGLLRAEIERLSDPMSAAFDPARADEMRRAIDRMNTAVQVETLGAFRAVLGTLQSFEREGSKGFKAMEAGIAALAIAQDALAMRAAVTAVLSQGQGDPYSAWARMAAMAAAVAPFLASIGMTLSGSVGGGGGGGPPAQQAMQGAGTVLGDSEAKSESILRATEITADATKQLVGINRGMLRALQALQASIGSASGMLARGAGGADFAGPGNPLDAGSRLAVSITNAVTGGILGGLAESVTRSILGARSRVSDIGILIGGGVITDLADGIEIGAYQQTQSRSWWGGSTRTREQVESLDDGVARQFELIIGSIVESVRQGALALGLSADDIEAAIESFRLEEIRISTMDLSAEEQQAELEAVFSSIFDGLAGHVVPFIAQFQQVGEGLGETLVRVATSVQVTQEAVRQLGFSMDTIDPETVAQISVELIAMAVGIDEFISGLATFVDKFAPESHKLEVAQDQLTRALDGVGLSLPGTRDEMWELMQSLDATTESGRAQIAILLELASVSDAYYTMLERGEEALERATQSYREFIDGFAPSEALDDPVADIRRREREAIEQAHAMAEAAGMQAAATEDLAIITAWAEREIAAVQAQYAAGMVAYREYMDTITDRRGYDSVRDAVEAERQSMIARANELARSAGMEGAATQDLARIHRWAAGQIAAATLRIRDEITRLVAELSSTGRFVPGQGYIEGAVSDFETGAGGAIERVGDAAQRMYQQQLAAIQRISDYLVSMQFGPLSALSPMEQLEAARSQLEILQTAAMAGDADAMAALPQAAQQYLQLLQGAYASGSQFGEGYAWVQELLQAVVDQGPTVEPGESGVWDGYPGLTPDTLRERDAELAAQEAEYRAGLAMDLAEHLGQLAELVNTPVLELAALLGVSLDSMVADLGVNLEDITGNAVLALASLADALGLSLGDLAGELGLELADLGGGVTELLDRMGHSLDAITAETVTAMVGLGQMLGMSLGEITEALGLELTDLADGLTELTEGVGIDLGNLTTQSVAALARLATDLGLDLGSLTAALAVDLGELTDSQSLLNQTFATQLAGLPENERDMLKPLFDAVTYATTEADANAAIAELEAAVNTIGGGTAAALAPYLDGVFPPEALTDLDYLGGIDTTAKAIKGVLDNQLSSLNSVSSSTSSMRTTLDRVRNLLRAQNDDAGLPTYAAGGWVNARTTLVAGEAGRELILPNHVSEFLARAGIPVNAGGMKEADTRRLEERLERIEAAITRADDRNVAVTEGGSSRVVGAVERASRDTNIYRSR